MRWVVLACALACACNRVFDLHEVVPRDGRVFDGLADVAHFCPAFGTLPEYSPIVHQAIAQNCANYTVSTASGLAVAQCLEVDGSLHIYQGPIDHELTRSAGEFPTPTLEISVDTPRLSPEGDVLFVDMFDVGLTKQTYMTFHPAANGSWLRGPDAGLPQFGAHSVPSRGPDRHVMFYHGSNVIQEFHDSGTLSTWVHVRDVAVADPVTGVDLSPDGLRMFVTNRPGTAINTYLTYADRASIADAFSAPTVIALPSAGDLFVAEDCTRAYMSSLETIFYVLEK